MLAEFEPSLAVGHVTAPPSKSMAHRLLICAGLSGESCRVRGVAPSQDVLATIDCLRAFGVKLRQEGHDIIIEGRGEADFSAPVSCRESGSTLRFFIPLYLLMAHPVTLTGKGRLMQRPLEPYADLCAQMGLTFEQQGDSLRLCGPLDSGSYTLDGSISSQFVSGLLFALPLCTEDSVVHLIPPIASLPYIEMTRQAQGQFGVISVWEDDHTLRIPGSQLYLPRDMTVEGDWSNAAFLDGFSMLGGSVTVDGLNPNSLQGDKVYRKYYKMLADGAPTLDIEQCPDLGPVLMALAAAGEGVVLTGTDRLRSKESDRGTVMAQELSKLGCACTLGDNRITVPKAALHRPETPLDGHNDHRIVMALSLLLSRLGGGVTQAEAVAKSYPDFFDRIRALGVRVTLREEN